MVNKTKFFLVAVLALILCGSCADDNDFKSLVGTWIYPSESRSSSPIAKNSKPPPIDGCTEKTSVTFDKNLTGIMVKENACNTDNGMVDFTWSIKENVLSLTFKQESGDDWVEISGTNTFEIIGDELIITDNVGNSIKLSRNIEEAI